MSKKEFQDHYEHQGFKGWIGVATRECTPPVGCYNRNWGAAAGDVATGVHRPLEIKAVAFSDSDKGDPLVYVSLELCLLRDPESTEFRMKLVEALNLRSPSQLILQCTHTHAAVPFSFSMQEKPGGKLLAEWCEHLVEESIHTAKEAVENRKEALLEWSAGSCALAVNRDFAVNGNSNGKYACGFNPNQPADQALTVGRVVALESGDPIAVLAHYACHPTTLAWQNSLISPDYIGAASETVKSNIGCPLIYMPGAGGELSPRRQYTDDVEIADQNGRILGYAILATIEGMLPVGSRYQFKEICTSGADLGVWEVCPNESISRELASFEAHLELLLIERPSMKELKESLARETERPIIERLERQISREQFLEEKESVRVPVTFWRIGNALLIGQAQEMYSKFQIDLRKAFEGEIILPLNHANGSHMGYIYTPGLAGKEVYQVETSPFPPETLGRMTSFCIEQLQKL